MSMYPHQQRMGGPQSNQARLNELLEQIRAEFDSQMRQAGEFEHQSEYIGALRTFFDM